MLRSTPPVHRAPPEIGRISPANALTHDILSIGLPPDMRSIHLNWFSVGALAALFLAAAVWLALEPRMTKPIAADDFVQALETHQIALIDRYFRERQNPNARAANDRSLLFAALLRGDRGVADRLLAAGASPDLSDDAGVTPLMLAAMHGDLEMVRALVARVSDVVTRDRAGHSALYY